MLIAPPTHLSPRLRVRDSRWELALRYVSATLATLLAIAGAALVMPAPFIWMMVALTLVGVPISLWLRLGEMRVGDRVLPRTVLNSLTVLLSFGAAIHFVFLPMREFFAPIFSGEANSTFWLNFGAGRPIEALVQLFLLFAGFRSFAIISDKDATLTTVPSFSVLLLLIPIQHNIEVVVYFVAWFFVAATLFALDHRSEVRDGVAATVPASVAGQDVLLGARSLATVLSTSLVAAVGISVFITSRNPEERSTTESAVTALATRLTNLALAMPEVSSNGGPERQIDFKNGPSLPSRARLWNVEAYTINRAPVRPAYWRMFTLANYNGLSWMPNAAKSRKVSLAPLNPRRAFLRQRDDIRDRRSEVQGGSNLKAGPIRRPSFENFVIGGPSVRPIGPFGGFRGGPYSGRNGLSNDRLYGFDVEATVAKLGPQFKKSGFMVRQNIVSQVPNIGFLPVQPGVRSISMVDSEQKEIRLRQDGAIDIGVVPIGQALRVLSDVPPLPEYGVGGVHAPTKQLSPSQIAASGLALSLSERALDLRLPATVPLRVRQLAASMLKRAPHDASNFTKASRLALGIQQGAVYTLRPPSIPDGHDATDFFLFEGARRGYCTYFAGALTVLCRTQGIPARVVSGFAGIKWEGPDAGVLREANAHAWTEVWVDGFGWTVVDATPDSDRGDNAPTWLESWSDWTQTSLSTVLDWGSAHQVVLELLGLAALAAWVLGRGGGTRLRSWKWQAAGEDDIERRAVAQAYGRTARAMTRRFRPKTASETPDEWLHHCAQHLSTSDAESLRRLTSLYLSARYGSRPLPTGTARLARETASKIAWKKVRAA